MGSARRPGRKLVLREEAEGKDIVGGAGQRRARLEVGLAGKRRLDREGAGSDDDDAGEDADQQLFVGPGLGELPR